MIELSPDQTKIQEAILAFVESKKPYIRIGGYAGTGKSTTIAETVRVIREKNPDLAIAFCCFTGKAAYVLRTKLEAAEILQDEYVGTIHGLMYKPIIFNKLVVGWKRVDTLEADLIVVDEASMVSTTIWNDLCSYKIPIIAVGDHGQLPPIGESLGLMLNPDHALTQIHRQAEGNPILALSVRARENGFISTGDWVGAEGHARKIKMSVRKAAEGVKDLQNTLFLSGYNWTRVTVNRIIRHRLGFTQWIPQVKEKVICLKNNREIGIFNGMGGTLTKLTNQGKHFYQATVLMDDGSQFYGAVVKKQFGAQTTLKELEGVDPKKLRELFDWGYCLTVHKAQGSEADNVVLFEERFPQMNDDDWRRWLYTGVTRARKNLLLIQGEKAYAEAQDRDHENCGAEPGRL